MGPTEDAAIGEVAASQPTCGCTEVGAIGVHHRLVPSRFGLVCRVVATRRTQHGGTDGSGRKDMTLPAIARGVAAMLLALMLAINPVAPVRGATTNAYVCAGDPLEALADNGAVDDPAIPNQSAGTVPGAFVVLRWRDLTLQLPRTNDAGAPSYSDGQWLWSLEDPGHPRFLRRRGAIESFACEGVPPQAPAA